MQDAAAIQKMKARYTALAPLMDERMRRHWAAAEANAYGRGGRQAVCSVTGLAPNTITKGQRELKEREEHPETPPSSRIRKPGGGRKQATVVDLQLAMSLDKLIDPATRGDPQSPLRWTCKSTAQLATTLTQQGHPVSPNTVGHLLKVAGYSLQGNRKSQEGRQHPDRNAQFEFINAMVTKFQAKGQPAVSVDAKKKENVGNFRNNGKEYQPKGKPEEVQVHDFMDKTLGKVTPYGVYDVTANQGWVSVGTDHDTAQFAAEAIHRWWKKMGLKRYRGAKRLLIMADGGGSNSSRSRLWKVALQGLANHLGRAIYVCHFPPGTSKWNKIEHRMFSHITQNWRGRPLVSHDVIINLIANTTTTQGLRIKAGLDCKSYPLKIKVRDEELAAVRIRPLSFHGEWNYCILPHRQKK